MLSNSKDLLGKALGTCTLQRLLGRGGMGAVYLAQQSRPHRTVAVKVLLPDLVLEEDSREEFLTRFRREADAIAALDHINIMPVFEYGEQGDTAYLVMPYVAGGTLRDVLEKRGKLRLDEALTIIEQAAAGLDIAHAKGIIHRDLKPGNMLFHADGRILLADFGLAKVLKDVTDHEESKGRFLTSVGTIVGTPEYLSPEQSTGNPVDHRSDVYSLGVVLFHMLAGRVPFQGASPVAVAIKHTLEMPPSLTQIKPDIPPAVEAVVMKAMAKSPDDRFSSAGAFARAFHAAVTGSPELEELLRPQQNDVQVEQKPFAPLPADPVPSAPLAEVQDIPTEEMRSPAAEEREPEKGKLVQKVLMDTSDIHGLPTEEAPRLAPTQGHDPDGSTIITSPNAADSAVPAALLSARPQQRTAVQMQEPRPYSQQAPSRAGYRSVAMMLVGSLLTLLVIAGGFFAYLKLAPTPTASNHNHTSPTTTTHIQASPTATSKPAQPPSHQQSVNIPPQAGIATVGSMIYGTALPGKTCDGQGAQWSNTANTQVTCAGSSTTQIVDGATVASQKSGTFLNTLPPGEQMPGDYMVQVQVTIGSSPQGQFGVFFRNQTGSSDQGAYSFLINPSTNQGGGYAYDSTGTGSTLTNSFPLQAPLSGTLTIDVVVRGSQFNFYINGVQQGYATSGGQYPSGTVGLAADAGANVSFKNLAIYPLS